MELNLKDRLAVVTGASQGIGAAIAKAFVDEGARVLLVDVNPQVEERAKELGQSALICDLTATDVSEKIKAAAADLGGAYTLVNNAGISRPSPLPEMSDADWDDVMNVNSSVAFRLIRALWPQLSEKSGSIVNLASFAAKRSTLFGNNASYVASKHAIAGLTRAAAFEGATQNVRVNAVAPGVVATEMVKLHNEETRAKIKALIPQQRYADPSEIADLVLFLSSDRAAHICGEVVNINGGLYMD